MTITNPDFYAPGEPSLQDLLDRAARDGTIPAPRLARIRTAVATYTRLMKRSAADLPGHQGHIIAQIARLKRGPTGLAPKTLANMRSELTHLIAVTRGRGPRSAFALNDGWAALREALNRGPDWWPLSRFAGFATRAGIAPAAVDDAAVDAFAAALDASGEIEKPESHVRRLARTWNRIGAADATFGLATLTIPEQCRQRWSLEETAFPASFRTDVDAWLDRSADDDPLAESPRPRLRPATIRHRRHQIFMTASALVFSGRPVETIRALADLVEIENVRAALRVLLDRQEGRITEALHGLAAGLLAVARHHVRVDATTEAKLEAIVRNLDRRLPGFRTKTHERLAAFENDPHLRALLHLPEHLLEDSRKTKSARDRRLLAQMAIAIETLTFAPMRVGNLAQLRPGHSLRPIRVGREERFVVELPAAMVKNGQDLTYELPAASTALLRAAMALYEQPDGWLFPGRGAGPKGTGLLAGQIKRIVEDRVGVAFHAHMFRALAGYLNLRENPKGLEATRALLGNRDDRVVREHYAFMGERALVKDAQAAIAKTRVRLAPPVARKRRAG